MVVKEKSSVLIVAPMIGSSVCASCSVTIILLKETEALVVEKGVAILLQGSRNRKENSKMNGIASNYSES